MQAQTAAHNPLEVLRKPAGVLLIAVAVFNLLLFLYPAADTVVVFRYCVGYWLFTILVALILFTLPPVIAYTAYGIYCLRKQQFKVQASNLQAPVNPYAVDAIAKKVAIGLLVFGIIFLTFLSLVLTVLVFSYHLTSVSIRRQAQFQNSFRPNITISRDEYLVPHIQTTQLSDVAFALAVTHAQDRLYQLDYLKRLVSGRLASFIGSDALQSDMFFRSLNFNATVYSDFETLDATTKDWLQSYADGINYYISSLTPQQRPWEYKVKVDDNELSNSFWTVYDSLSILKMMQFVMSGNLEAELLRFHLLTNQKLNVTRVVELIPGIRYDAPTSWSLDDLDVPSILVRARVTTELNNLASDVRNSETLQTKLGVQVEEPSDDMPDVKSTEKRKWVPSLTDLLHKIEGSHHYVKNGKDYAQNSYGFHAWYSQPDITTQALLASGFGLPLQHQSPSFWYVNYFRFSDVTSGNYDAHGLSVPGFPGVFMGRTLQYSWSMTPTMADTMDLYIVQDVPDTNGTQYFYNGQAVNYDIRTEEFKVKDGSTVRVTMRRTIHGPVISDSWERFTELSERPNAIEGVRIALKWTGLTGSDTTSSWFVENWRNSDEVDFILSAEKIVAPSVHLLFSQTDTVSYTAAGTVPSRASGHSGRFPVDGSSGAYTWTGSQTISRIDPALVRKPVGFLAGNRPVPPGFLFNMGYDFEESYRFEVLEELITSKVYSSDGTSVISTLTDDDIQESMESKQSGLYFGLKGALSQTAALINSEDLTYGTSNVLRKLNNLLSWNGELVSNGNANLFESWYRKELTRLGQWESKIRFFERPQFIVNTLCPVQNTSLTVTGYDPTLSADQIERNNQRCRKALILLYEKDQSEVNSLQYPCNEYIAVSLEKTSVSSLVKTINFRHAATEGTAYSCTCARKVKDVNGGILSLNPYAPQFQFYVNNDNAVAKFRVQHSNNANQWEKRKYDKNLGSESYLNAYISGDRFTTKDSITLPSTST